MLTILSVVALIAILWSQPWFNAHGPWFPLSAIACAILVVVLVAGCVKHFERVGSVLYRWL